MAVPTDPLATAIGALPGWLELTGCCRWIAYYPLRLMAERYGGRLLLAQVLPRLRCSHCGGRPKVIALVEDPAGEGDGNHGGPNPGWRIDFASEPPYGVTAVRQSTQGGRPG